MDIHFSLHLMGKAYTTRCFNGNLSLPPSGGGKVRMGVALWI